MKNKSCYLLMILAIFCASCSARTESVQQVDTTSIKKVDSSAYNSTGDILERGIYYAYQTCLSKNMGSLYTCKKGFESKIVPSQDQEGKFIIDFGKSNKTDEFYFINNGNDSSIYFSYTVMEGWVVGWAPAKINEKNGNFLVEGDIQIQTDGIPADGDESTEINSFENKARRVVGENSDGHKMLLKYSFNFNRLSSSEFVLNCKEYTSKERNQFAGTFSPITNLCERGVAQVWFKRIADVSKAYTNSSSRTAKTQNMPSKSSDDFDFNKYSVSNVYSGKGHEAIITEANKNMRTRLRLLAKEPVAFAGHYAVARVGCGFDCIFHLILDLQTGVELEFANSIDTIPALMRCENENIDNYIEIKPNSRLLIAYGRQADGDLEDGSCMARYYEERDGKLYLLHKQKIKAPS